MVCTESVDQKLDRGFNVAEIERLADFAGQGEWIPGTGEHNGCDERIDPGT